MDALGLESLVGAAAGGGFEVVGAAHFLRIASMADELAAEAFVEKSEICCTAGFVVVAAAVIGAQL